MTPALVLLGPLAASPADLFARRILPIFRSPDPSSCTQCHLASVDLKSYILPSHEETFLALRDQGLIDLTRPERSKILRFIRRGEDQGAPLIQARVRRAEYQAFAAWIRASARDPRLRSAPAADRRAGPARPPEVIRHGRTDRVLDGFVRSVWAQRMRCTSCHAADGADNAKHVAEHGEEVTWIRESPEATLRYLVTEGLFDLDAPDRSLLLRKPTGEVK